jgi:hypothetical protein
MEYLGIKRKKYGLEKDRNLRIIFQEEFMVLKLTIWERFNGFGTNIHPWK